MERRAVTGRAEGSPKKSMWTRVTLGDNDTPSKSEWNNVTIGKDESPKKPVCTEVTLGEKETPKKQVCTKIIQGEEKSSEKPVWLKVSQEEGETPGETVLVERIISIANSDRKPVSHGLRPAAESSHRYASSTRHIQKVTGGDFRKFDENLSDRASTPGRTEFPVLEPGLTTRPFFILGKSAMLRAAMSTELARDPLQPFDAQREQLPKYGDWHHGSGWNASSITVGDKMPDNDICPMSVTSTALLLEHAAALENAMPSCVANGRESTSNTSPIVSRATATRYGWSGYVSLGAVAAAFEIAYTKLYAMNSGQSDENAAAFPNSTQSTKRSRRRGCRAGRGRKQRKSPSNASDGAWKGKTGA